jgi:hypothetical protein
MIEICERNRFSNFYGYDHAYFPCLGRWVRWFERVGIPARLYYDTERQKYAVYREGLMDDNSKPLPYGHRVDRRVA